MLDILQALSLIAAFFLPWMIGFSIGFRKKRENDKFILTLICSIVCVCIIGLALFMAFSLAR